MMSDDVQLTNVKYAALCVTHDCNLRCGYCYAGRKFSRRMEPETAAGAIDFLYRESDGSCIVTFFGGEPLLEIDLIREIVAYSRECYGRSIGFRMSTNGTLLTPAIIDYLHAERIYFVLSLDGGREQHDCMRRFPDGGGSYDLAVRYLDRILERNPYTIAVSVVVPETVGYIADGAVDLFERGFRYVLQTLDYSAAWSVEHMANMKRQYELLARFYFDNLSKGRKIYYSPFDERIKTHAQRPYYRGDLCDLANSQIAIAPSGAVYPCVQFIGTDDERHREFTIGNVFEGFETGRRRSCVDENYREKLSCAGCSLEGRCATGCGCVNWRATGCISCIPAVICEHERMLMPIVDRLANKLWRKKIPLFRRKFYDKTFPISSYIEDCMIARREAAARTDDSTGV